MSYDKQLAAAKTAVSLAARLSQKVQKSLLQSDIQSKSDRSPVTVADYGSQALVSFILEKELPTMSFSLVAEEDSADLCKEESRETLHRITKLVNETLASDGMSDISALSEEDVLMAIDKGKSEGGPHSQHWILDPIDGTNGFIRGDQYAIALALLDKGKVVLAVLACPNLPLVSVTSNGHQCTSKDKDKVQVTATNNPEEASLFESFEAAHYSHDLSSLIIGKLGVKALPVRIDSQAKYCTLSRGDGAIYMCFPRNGYHEKIWDHAAGYMVVTEAGGIVVDASGNPLDFSRGRYLDLDTGIIATNQKLMPSLLRALQESIKEKASSL
ncbi:hypothetical protein DH2020_012621 [Rehmannia glutinosa]|uniref:3'(2'),5'-bisphosphate nucleotidase n=1 Tax=Rehmannia glutinosa TaxID=99300 RepID=A0ABR0X301_REHGL